jgi:hypothetical protein
MPCFCEDREEDRCCSFCAEKYECAQVCHVVKFGDDCRNPTFRRLESEREEEV